MDASATAKIARPKYVEHFRMDSPFTFSVAAAKLPAATFALLEEFQTPPRQNNLLGWLDRRTGLFDAPLNKFGLHFRFLTGQQIDFRFKGPVTR